MPDGGDDALLRNLARNARAARLRLGLTIEELAEHADLDVLTLEAIERGEGHRLTMLGLDKLARALAVPASALLADAERSTRG